MANKKIYANLLFFIVLLFFGCKEDRVLVNPNETECRDSLLLEPVFISNKFQYGGTVSFALQSNMKQVDIKGLTFVIEKPDGSKTSYQHITIQNFQPKDEQVYVGYVALGNCRSKKAYFKPTPYVHTAPCTVQENWLDVKGFTGFENLVLTKVEKKIMNSRYYFYGEADSGKKKVTIITNKDYKEQGEYKLTFSTPPSFGSSSDDNWAYIGIQISSSDVLKNYSNGIAHIARNPITGKLEFIVCAEPLKPSSSFTNSYNTTLNLVLE